MSQPTPLRVAICGIGGFASSHHREFAALEKHGALKVVATCDPALDRLGEACLTYDFAQRGVATYATFEDMMTAHADGLDLGVVATPIHCHASMHEALVRRGIACYLEKPPTLDPREFDQMLEVEKAASTSTHVGFSYIHLADRLALKHRIVAGEFGKPRGFSFTGLVARKPSYFARNNWAGRLRLGEQLVLDSCLGNAMAHSLNSMLFWAGTESVAKRARPLAMESELYRVNSIEGCDTIFASCLLDNGTTLRLAATHACRDGSKSIRECMVFENATITIDAANKTSIAWRDGHTEEFEVQPPNLISSIEAYLEFFHGHTDRPPQSLEDSLGFVQANALLYCAARAIHTVDAAHLEQASPESPRAIRDVEQTCCAMADEGLPPSRSNAPWGCAGGHAKLADINSLLEKIMELTRSSIHTNEKHFD